MRHALPLAASLLAAVVLAPVAGAVAADVTVENPWARETSATAKAGAAFMDITSTGAADRLVAASSDVSETVELHTHIEEGGVFKMRPVDAIDVPAGGTAPLQPGGDHVMFIGLKAPLKAGTTFPLTLTFENAGDITVDVTVMDMAATGLGDQGMMGHGTMGHGDAKAPMKQH